MNRPSHHTILAEPLGYWVANCDKESNPDIVKCTGLLFPDNLEQITFFISDKFSSRFRANLYPGSQIAFMGCSVYSFESYQYKGKFFSIRDCTLEEEEIQRKYIGGFTDALQSIGFPKEGFFNAYYHQPSHAITMSVSDIFEQTPHKGTGNRVINSGTDGNTLV